MAQQSLPLSTDPEQQDLTLELINQNERFVMSGYSAYGSIAATNQPEIINTLQQLPIETEVVTKAIEVFYEIGALRAGESPLPSGKQSTRYTPRTKSVKGSRKFRCMFYCIFMAYSKLHYPVDPAYAADIVGLPRNEIEQAFTEYSPSGAMLMAPEDLLRFYIKRINLLLAPTGVQYNESLLEREARKVIQVCKSTHIGREWVQNTAAKVVAIVSLYFYMNDIKGLEIAQNIQVIEQACYLSWACIRRYHEQIVKYYNADTSIVSPPGKVVFPF